jgi:hypothetical protein
MNSYEFDVFVTKFGAKSCNCVFYLARAIPPHRFVAAGEIDVQNPVPNNAGFLSSSRVRQVGELTDYEAR